MKRMKSSFSSNRNLKDEIQRFKSNVNRIRMTLLDQDEPEPRRNFLQCAKINLVQYFCNEIFFGRKDETNELSVIDSREHIRSGRINDVKADGGADVIYIP